MKRKAPANRSGLSVFVGCSGPRYGYATTANRPGQRGPRDRLRSGHWTVAGPDEEFQPIFRDLSQQGRELG